MLTVLETKDDRGRPLWIDKDPDPRFSIYMLDCGFDGSGRKVYGELPRCYRTERGARQAAALLTEEKLKWSAPTVIRNESPPKQPPARPNRDRANPRSNTDGD